MSGQPYIHTPSGKRIRIGSKRAGKLLRKRVPWYTVTIVSECEWAESTVPTVQVIEGGSVTIPLNITMGADYTYVGAIGGTVTEDGLTVDNVTADVTVKLVPAKEPYVITIESLCDWASTESGSYYGFEGQSAIIPVILTDGADDTTISVSEGILSNGSIVIDDIHSDVDVAINPAKVQIIPDLSNTENILDIVPSVTYGVPTSTVEFTVTYADGHGPDDVAMPGGTFVGNTLTYVIPEDTWSVRPAITDSISNIEVLIGSGESSRGDIPLNTYYNYSLSEQLYEAAEIGAIGTIKTLAFNIVTRDSSTRTIDIYMAHTNKTAFSSYNDWVAMSDSDKVFSGTIYCGTTGWHELTLTTPFEYDGHSNLLIMVDDNTGSYNSSGYFATFDGTKDATLYIYNDNTNYSPESAATYGGTKTTSKNQLKMVISGERLYTITIDSSACPWASTEIDSAIVRLGDTLSIPVTLSNGADFSTISVSDGTVVNGAIVLTNIQSNVNVVISPTKVQIIPDISSTDRVIAITPSVIYGVPGDTATFTVTYADGYGDEDVTVPGGSFDDSTMSYLVPSDVWYIYPKIEDVYDNREITIGNESSSTGYYPIRNGYYYTACEQIITANEIGTAATIKSISFKVPQYSSSSPTIRCIDLYIKHTNKTQFSSTTGWIIPSDDDKVYSGLIYIGATGWYEMQLNKPFVYNGSDYLLIALIDNSGESLAGIYFSTISSSSNKVLYASNNDAPYTQEKLSLTTGTRSNYRTYWKMILSNKPVERSETTIGLGIGPVIHSLYIYAQVSRQYAIKQQIILANEVNMAGLITKLSLYVSYVSSGNRNVDVYLGYTNVSSYASASNMITQPASNVVFSGTLNMSHIGWLEIPLDTPFNYDGVNNLLVTINDKTGTGLSTDARVYGYQVDGNSRFISKYNSSAYDPADSNTLRYGTGYTSQFCMVANLTFKTDSPVYTVSIETNCTWVSPRTTHISTTEGNSVTVPITFTDGADSSTITISGGTLVNGAIVVSDIQSDVTVTINPAKVQVNASLLDTNVITAISPTCQYVSPGDTAQIICTYASGMSASDATVSTGTITGNTWYIPTSSANWVISASAYAAGSGYTYFKLDITAIRSGSIVQLSELELYNNSGTKIPLIYVAGTGGYSSSEGGENLYDGNTSTKFCASFPSEGVYQICRTATPELVAYYTLTTANDTASNSGRNPKTWTLCATNEPTSSRTDSSWVVIDRRENDTTMQAVNYTPYTFTVNGG